MGELPQGVREAIWDKVQELLSRERVASPDHVHRMVQWCERLGRAAGADMEVLVAGALVHDVGVTVNRKLHFTAGRELARGILLSSGFTQARVEDALHVMEAHSRYGGPEPRTLEAKVARDADAIEYLGAIGIVRAVVRGLTDGSFSGRAEDFPVFLRQVMEKVRSTFQIEGASRIAQDRIKFMEEFLKRMEEELSFMV